ncbi:MAG: hypothetical protein SFV22_08830 [Saprospiraceae bacterium]|nr:hypothetical protein [Saprospiraceae bacterium]
MTQQQLIEVMKYHLRNFNDEGVNPVDENVIHHQILSASDGIGRANSKDIYKAFVRWTLIRSGHADKNWPDNWMETTVLSLSSKLL